MQCIFEKEEYKHIKNWYYQAIRHRRYLQSRGPNGLDIAQFGVFSTNYPGQYVADKFYLLSTTDKEAVLKVAQEGHIHGIVTYSFAFLLSKYC